MLTQEAISGAYPLATLLTRKGQQLSAIAGSPLADLVDACAALPVEGLEPQSQSLDAQLMENSALEDFDGICEHSQTLDEVVSHASQAVNFTMDLARNTVLPATRKVEEAALAAADAVRQQKSQPLVIEQQFLDSIYTSPELGDLIAPYSKAMLGNVEPLRLSAQWSDDALASGISSMDSLAATTLQSDAAKELWERFFAAVPGKYRDGLLSNELKSKDDALVVFLGANKLIESDVVPEGLSCSLADYRLYLAKLREQAGALLYHRIQAEKGVRSGRQLVISMPAKPAPGGKPAGKIVVNGEVYLQWLEAGGSPEALFGAVLTGTTPSYDVLLANAASLKAEWDRVANLADARAKYDYYAALIRGMRQALVDLAKEISGQATLSSETYARIDERLTHFHAKDVDNVYGVARKAVCRIFYPHTDAEKFLNAMDAVAAEKPDLNPREVALLVALDYVTDWVAGFIQVSPADA